MPDLINGRTAEEIKRALAVHGDDSVRCDGCPYDSQLRMDCSETLCGDAFALIDQLEAERDAALAKVPKWISVEEWMPEQYQTVIVHVQHTEKWSKNTPRDECWRVVEEDCWLGDRWDVNADSDIHEVTHWMPLPEPPVEKKEI